MDVRELSGIASSETSNMIVDPNSYGSGAGITDHSMAIANSAGTMLPLTSMFSSFPTPLEGLGTIYTGGAGQGMRHANMFNLVEPLKKKRGRPRKYVPDGGMELALCHNSSNSNYSRSLSEPTAKRRGRPPGSRKKQQLDALGPRGTAFTPHVITVKAGEDVASKIMAFSHQGPRTVCILSANGAVSNATIRQAVSGESAAYEDHFEIISLSGSYLAKENEGSGLRTSGLIVALAGSNGRVIAGEVGRLTAASPVQVVVGSFVVAEKKSKPVPPPAPAPTLGFHGEGSATSLPPSRESLSESDERMSANNYNSGYHLQGGLNPEVGAFN